MFKKEVLINAYCPALDYSSRFVILRETDENITDLWADQNRLAAGLASLLYFEIEKENDRLISVRVFMNDKLVNHFYHLEKSGAPYLQLVSQFLRDRTLIESFLQFEIL